MTVDYSIPRTGGISAKITLNAATSEPVFVPASNVGLEAVPASGTCRFEQTCSTEAEVEAGTATWFTWSSGDVSGPTSSIVLGAVAVRGVATGNAKLYVRW